MEGMQSLPKLGGEHHFSGTEQKLHRVTGRLLDLMLDRVDSGDDPTLTRDVVFERLSSVKDNLPEAQAALDHELQFHQGALHDQWGWGSRK